MNICFLDNTNFSYNSNDLNSSKLRGAETVLINLATSLSNLNHQVSIINNCPKNEKIENINWININSLKNKNIYDLAISNNDCNLFDKIVSSKKIIITSGKTEVPIFDKIISKNFKKINQNKFVSTKYNNKLKFFNNSTFQELELFVKNSSVVFCCEGAISHISHCFNKKTFAFIDNFITGMFWTAHMQNITLLKRENIKNICNKIKYL